MKPLMIIAPIVLVAVVGILGLTGKINIPGLTQQPKKATKKTVGDQADKVVVKSSPNPIVQTPPISPVLKKPVEAKGAKKDVEQGADALATVWNEIDTPELIAMSKTWKDEDLVRVLTHMDNDKVAKFLDLMAKGDPDSNAKGDPVRASKLSKVLQDQGSIVKQEVEGRKTT